eukprot:TRINITY_DN48184_c0_g1_i1.p1 TRINITY_DN48184_c0_g1~~TRINITY_DN48184_c0_g1_i1.p1  ORF type:complete len:521 (-),score=58.34 TRINITY_DN48184_c0_g1_i1:164-1726(-)
MRKDASTAAMHPVRTASVADLVLFTDNDKHLRRGIRFNVLLSRGAKLYASNKGSASSYNMSEEVERLGAFISHNWIVGRISKFITLAFHMHWSAGTLLTYSLVFAIAACTAAFSEGRQVLCMAASIPSFTCVIIFASDVKKSLGFLGPACFVDKTCIHQTDEKLQRRGILKLGAFIQAADQFIILYSDVYLSRLWTVYEIACWLSMHGTAQLRILSTFKAWMLVVLLLKIYTIQFSASFVMYLFGLNPYEDDRSLAVFLTCLAFIIAMCPIIRIWKRKVDKMQVVIAQFRVREALCHVASDRPLVYRNIARLMQAAGLVDFSASEDVALDRFDEYVHVNVSHALGASLGHTFMSYREKSFIHFIGFMPDIVDNVIAVWRSEGVTRTILVVANTLSFTFLAGVAMLQLIDFLIGRCMHLRGALEVAYVTFCGLCYLFLGGVYFACIVLIQRRSLPFAIALPLTIVLHAVILGVKLWADRCFPWRAHQTADESAKEPETHHDDPALAAPVRLAQVFPACNLA